jgi:methionyl-tRNA formyltransferase
MKIFLATNYKVGEQCKKWLKKNLPVSWEYTDNKDECDCFISVLSKEIIKQDFIDKRPCFNFHFGILPDYKGTGTIIHAIVNKEKRFGITLHLIDATIDGGNIIDIRYIPIEDDETGESLFNKCCEQVVPFFKEYAEKLIMRNFWSVKQVEQPWVYKHKHIETLKDITSLVRAFTFEGKEPLFYINKKGKKKYIKWND